MVSPFQRFHSVFSWNRHSFSFLTVLDSAFHPDINSELVRASQQGNVASALLVKDEAYQWGYDISPASCSELFKALFVSPGYVIYAIDLMEEMPDMFNKLDAQNRFSCSNIE